MTEMLLAEMIHEDAQQVLSEVAESLACERETWGLDGYTSVILAALQTAFVQGKLAGEQAAGRRRATEPPAPSYDVPWPLVRQLSRRCRELVFAWAGSAAIDTEPLGPQEIQDTFKCLQAAADYLDNFEKFAAIHAEPPAPQEWQSIETAPKDGTPILGCKPTWTHPYVLSYLNGAGLVEGWHDFNISPSGRRPHDLTHWMPLPAAPPAQTSEP